MDKKLSKQAFDDLVEAAYPTYVVDLNQKCFTKCVRPGQVQSRGTIEIVKEKIGEIVVGNAEEGFKTGAELSVEESECIGKCASTYARMLDQMFKNFEKRTCQY